MNRLFKAFAMTCAVCAPAAPLLISNQAHAASCQVAGPITAGHGGVITNGCGAGGGGGGSPPPPPPPAPPPGGTPALITQLNAVGIRTSAVAAPAITSIPAVSTNNWGTSDAQFASNFPSVIYYNFVNNPNLCNMLANIPNAVLARLSTELLEHDVNNWTFYILQNAAERCSAAVLVQLTVAFGVWPMIAVESYMPPAVEQVWGNTSPLIPIPGGALWRADGLGNTGTASPYYDVFLDAITAGPNGDPVAAQLQATSYIQGVTGEKPNWLTITDKNLLSKLIEWAFTEACAETECLTKLYNWLTAPPSCTGLCAVPSWLPGVSNGSIVIPDMIPCSSCSPVDPPEDPEDGNAGGSWWRLF